MSRRVRRQPGGRWFAAALLLLIPTVGAAQTPPSSRSTRSAKPAAKWEIGIHGGGVLAGVPIQGIGTVPDHNPFFATVNGGAVLSRHVPSWFFGDGSLLFAEVASLASTNALITPADSVTSGPSSNPGNTWNVGVRVGRALNPRVAIEGTFEFSRSTLRLVTGAVADLETTRASFVTGWNALFATDPATFQNPSVTATTTIVEGAAHQLVGSGALVINILTRRRNTPYVTAGVGAMSNGGGGTSVTMVGHYTTQLNGTAPIDETDRLTIRYAVDRTLVAVSVGLGLKHMVTERWGLRGEMREQLCGNPITHLVSASPQLVLTSNAAQQGAAATPRFSSLQLSNIANSSTQSSLGGSLDGFKTFTGTGMEHRLSFTGGIFWRF